MSSSKTKQELPLAGLPSEARQELLLLALRGHPRGNHVLGRDPLVGPAGEMLIFIPD